MPKLRALFFFAAVLLCGCDHHDTATQNEASAQGDSELTGIPAQPLNSRLKIPPRATLVALPPGPSATPAYQPSSAAVTVVSVNNATPAATTHADLPSADTNAAPAALATLPPSQPPSSASTDMPGSSAAASSPAAAGETASPASQPAADSAPDPNRDQLVILDTTYGRIIIALDDFAAPKTCKNFRQLVQDGFYNNTVFHRVIPNFIIQGGDPNSKSSATNRDTYGLGGPGYTIPAEINLKHDRGAIAMARLPDSINPQKDSNGSQFYICLAPCPTLDDQYTVFGHIIQGMDVADKIAEAPRDQRDNPLARVQMTMSLESKDQALGAGSAANP